MNGAVAVPACNQAVASRLHDLVGVYAVELPDPTATEVLLVVNAVLDIFGLSAYWREVIYGPRVVAFLEHWDDELGPTPGPGSAILSPWANRIRPIRRVIKDRPPANPHNRANPGQSR